MDQAELSGKTFMEFVQYEKNIMDQNMENEIYFVHDTDHIYCLSFVPFHDRQFKANQ